MADERWQEAVLQGQSPDAEPAFDEQGHLRTDAPATFPQDDFERAHADAVQQVAREGLDVDPPEQRARQGGAAEAAEQERARGDVSRETSGPATVHVEPGPAPTGEENVERDDVVRIQLNLDKIKLRELRGAEIILEIVLGRFYAVLPNLDVLPANVAFALLAQKKLLHDRGIDVSRMGLDDAAQYANEIREAWTWAEDLDFAQLGGPMAQPGEGPEPRDPLSASNGGVRSQTVSAT